MVFEDPNGQHRALGVTSKTQADVHLGLRQPF
jgi:hypothetical protein